MLQRAWSLTLGNGTLIFLGYAVPLWFSQGQIDFNPIREIIIATRLVIDVVVAFVLIDIGKFGSALMRPETLPPHSFVFGRWGLAMAVAGIALLVVLDAVRFVWGGIPHPFFPWLRGIFVRKGGRFATRDEIAAIKQGEPRR